MNYTIPNQTRNNIIKKHNELLWNCLIAMASLHLLRHRQFYFKQCHSQIAGSYKGILLGQSLQYHAYVSTATSTHQLFVVNTELAIVQFQLVSCVPQWVIVQCCKRRVHCKEFLKATHGSHLQVQKTYMRGQGFGLVENRNLRKFPKRNPCCSSCLVELGGGVLQFPCCFLSVWLCKCGPIISIFICLHLTIALITQLGGCV